MVKGLWELLRETFGEWSEDKAPRLGAALAYYTTLSTAPLLVVMISALGVILGPEQAQRSVVTALFGLFDPSTAAALTRFIENTRQGGAGLAATVISVVTLLVAASGLFAQLQDALNTIWEVETKPGRGLLQIVRERLLSFVMVLAGAALLLVSLALSAGLALLGNLVTNAAPLEINLPLFRAADLGLSLVVTTIVFALLFKFVPDVQNTWRDVWIGAGVTAALFTLGKLVLAFYLGRSTATSVYGAAGALVIVLLWTYYSAQILFLGAEFTQVYSRRRGARRPPAANAVPVTEEKRAEQGMPHHAALARAAAPPRRIRWLRRPRLPARVRRLGGQYRAGAALLGFVAGLLIGLVAWSRGLPRR